MIVKDLKDLKRERITFVIGTFDILHVGHIHFLKKAKESASGNKLLVGIIPDEIVKKRKHHTRPVISQKQRLELIDSIKYVDYSTILPSIDVGLAAQKVINHVHPKLAVVPAADWKRISDKMELNGTKIAQIRSKVPEISTTQIIKRIGRK